MDDLTLGRVIRQKREVTRDGSFSKIKTNHREKNAFTMKSPFDSVEPYELTELGKGFVHYVLTELTQQIESSK